MNPQIQNHDSMLKESINHFLISYHRGSSDFSSFESIFFRLIQSMLDPPLGVTWFYSAVTFHAAKSSSQNTTHPPSRVLITKDLLNLLISCSNLSSASKKISLLAPVVYDLYNIVCDYGRAVNAEARKLVEDMVSHVTTSAMAYDYGDEDTDCDDSVVCFEDLVRVWTTDRGGGFCDFEENLRVFFPLLSSGIWKWVSGGGCGVRELVGIVLCEVYFLRMLVSFSSGMCTEDFLRETFDQTVQSIEGFRSSYFLGEIKLSHENVLLEFFFPNMKSDFQREAIVCVQYMAGVVMNEAFLMSFYMKVSTEIRKDGLQKILLNLAIQGIKGFRNFYFLDVLFKMLLEPSLPVASLLSFVDADILHKALYDAVILIDYSFYSGRWAQSTNGHSKNFALLWVLVAERAIHFARAKNDEARAILYLSAFRKSKLMAELIEWASIQAGIVDQNNRTGITTPNALIKWLLALEDRGIRVFDDSVSLLYAKAVFKVETNGDLEMAGSSDRFMNTVNGAGRKRKETESALQEMRVMQVRRVSYNVTHFGVEIKNISSEDEMES